MADVPTISFRYTNWRGETRMRRVVNMGRPLLGRNDWHPEEQWLFDARDAETGEMRTFALKDCDFTATAEPA